MFDFAFAGSAAGGGVAGAATVVVVETCTSGVCADTAEANRVMTGSGDGPRGVCRLRVLWGRREGLSEVAGARKRRGYLTSTMGFGREGRGLTMHCWSETRRW